MDGANERVGAPAADGLATDGRGFPVRDSRAFISDDADDHAEDVWHTRHDGTEDVRHD